MNKKTDKQAMKCPKSKE